MDLRGHGQSEAPLDAENYTRGGLWADDVAGVIGALDLVSPILVGWSYGGLIIGDYLRVYGDDDLAAVNLVCAAVGIGPSWFGPLIGADFVEYAPLAASEDQGVALTAVHALLHRMFVGQVSPDDLEMAARVRQVHLCRRERKRRQLEASAARIFDGKTDFVRIHRPTPAWRIRQLYCDPRRAAGRGGA